MKVLLTQKLAVAHGSLVLGLLGAVLGWSKMSSCNYYPSGLGLMVVAAKPCSNPIALRERPRKLIALQQMTWWLYSCRLFSGLDCQCQPTKDVLVFHICRYDPSNPYRITCERSINRGLIPNKLVVHYPHPQPFTHFHNR